MSIKQTGPRSFFLRVQWRDPKTGRKRSSEESFEGNARGAKAREAEMRAGAKVAAEPRPRLRLEAFARSWMIAREPRLKPSVIRRYASALDIHIIPALGDHYLDMIDRDDVQAYVAARTKAGAQGGTVMNELRLLRSMARDATADDHCVKNWTDRVQSPRVRRWTEERPNLLTAQQLAAVLLEIPLRYRALVTLLAFTGLRWGEASALRWGDLDEAKGSIRVQRSNWRGFIVEVKTSGSKRTVPLPPPVAAMLAASGRGKPDQYLFTNKMGRLHKGNPLVKIMVTACKAAEVPYTTPHGLRRTFNNLARQVVAAQVVKSITGHATDTMLEHYSMVGIGEKAEATRLVMQLVATTVPSAADPADPADPEDDPEPPEPEPASAAEVA